MSPPPSLPPGPRDTRASLTRDPSTTSREATLALRAFSPVVARLLDAYPELHRSIDSTPSPRALHRTSSAGMRQALRRLRRRTLVHTAYRELAGWSPLETAALWSDVAEGALKLADRVAAEETSTRLGVLDCGRAILGLGKLGSLELNPSSDIDIVCVYENDDVISDTGVSAHEWHTDWARRIRSILADHSDDGFVFRVDFDLRPEGTKGPLVNSIDATERYYERFGRVWERVALLRVRPVVDIKGVGAELLRRLQPFIFKRSFDARVVDELFGMKARLEDASVRALEHGYDVKRGVGGIREVEFIAQSLVLLHAGRIPDLRRLQGQPTVALIDALEDHDLLPFRTVRDLREAYSVLRRLEHAIQYGEDRQTHELPNVGEERERIFRGLALGLMHQEGQPWRALLAEPDDDDDDDGNANSRAPTATFDAALSGDHVDVELAERIVDDARRQVHEAFVRHLGEARDDASDAVRLALDIEEDDAPRQEALARAGFPDPPRAFELLRLLERRRGGPFSPMLRVDARARRFTERVLELVGNSVDPMVAMERLVDVFPGRAHPGLLERLSNDRTVGVVTRLLALSAPLSRSLARLARIGRVDDTLLFALDARRPSIARLLRLMGAPAESTDPAAPSAPEDDETAVGRLWLVKQEAIFSAALPFMARLTPTREHDDSAFMVGAAVVESQRRLSIVAEACIRRALQIAERRLARRHGTLPGARFAVLALGSLGGRELGFFRDLDLAFVYDTDDEDRASDGARPITAGEWAVRLAQQVLWVLTAPTAADPLYPVDTRLRPSGSHGALTTSLARFRAYHAQESVLWERQSLLRLRPLAGDAALGAEALACARAALAQPSTADIGSALIQMRTRMVEERAARRGFDLKLGRGGIADIEFAVQGAQLAWAHTDPGLLVASTRRALSRLGARGLIDPNDGLLLRLGLDRLVRLRELLNIVDDLRPGVVTFGDDRVATLVASGAIPDSTNGDDAVAEVGDVMGEIAVVARRVLENLPSPKRGTFNAEVVEDLSGQPI